MEEGLQVSEGRPLLAQLQQAAWRLYQQQALLGVALPHNLLHHAQCLTGKHLM